MQLTRNCVLWVTIIDEYTVAHLNALSVVERLQLIGIGIGQLLGLIVVDAYFLSHNVEKEEEAQSLFANSSLDISHKFVIKSLAEHLGLSLLPRLKEGQYHCARPVAAPEPRNDVIRRANIVHGCAFIVRLVTAKLIAHYILFHF